jgi:hypothetical protein
MSDNIVFNSKKEKNWLLTLLREQEITVKFVKKDGSEREMLCTLNESKIPSEKAPKGVERTTNDDVVPVFDIENQGWRSFRWDSITGIHFDLHK